MDLRLECLRLIERWSLGPEASARLRALASPPRGTPVHDRLRTAALILGGLLLGAGSIFFVAANWDNLDRTTRFALAQGAVAAPALLAFLFARIRTACLLVAFLATGALLALIGQTYQTGADPWQLFALWAALALPWVAATRNDVLRVPLVMVFSVAIWLWQDAHGGWRLWGDHRQGPLILLGSALHLLPVFLVLAARRFGGGDCRWSLRTAFLCLFAHVGYAGMRGLMDEPHWLWFAATPAALLSGVWLLRLRPFDLANLSLAGLLVDTLLISGIGRLIVEHANAGSLLVLSLVAAGIVGGTVVLLMRAARRERERLEAAP